MSESIQTSREQKATLELESGVRLGGILQAQSSEVLILHSAKLLRGSSNSGAVNLRGGTPANLALESDGPAGNQVRAIITGIQGKSVHLRLDNPKSDASKHCLAALGLASDDLQSMLASLEGISPEYSAILRRLAADSIDGLALRFEDFISELRLHLMELSLRSGGTGLSQQQLDETCDGVKNNSSAIAQKFISGLTELYTDLTPDQYEQPGDLDNGETTRLGLIDLDVFEHDLTVNRLVQLGSELYDLPLECLTLRIAELIGAEPQTVRLPIHIKYICQNFLDSLQDQPIPSSATPLIFKFFETQLLRQLGEYYQGLSTSLYDEGILPGIEEQIIDTGSVLRRPQAIPMPDRPKTLAPEPESKPAMDEQVSVTEDFEGMLSAPAQGPDTATAETAPANEPYTTAQPQAQQATPLPGSFADKLYSSLMNAVHVNRDGGSAGESGYAPQTAPQNQSLASSTQLAEALRELQSDPDARQAIHASDSLRNYLHDHHQNISGLQGTSGLATDSLNQLDIVDRLFTTLSGRLEHAQELQPTLGNLQVPLARLAMLEPRFILDRQHPARDMVDKIAELSSTANLPNRSLERRIDAIIEEVVEGYDEDSQVFEKARGEVDKLLEQQKRMLSRNMERVVKTQEGQEKLNRARATVDKAIADTLPYPEAPSALLQLVENGWRDLMVLTYIKEGEKSAAYTEQVQVLETLTDWLEQQCNGSISEAEKPLRSELSKTLLDDISSQLTASLPATVGYRQSVSQLQEVLSGEVPVALEPATRAEAQEDPAQRRAKIEDLPRLRRWIGRVEQLQTGSWLSYRDAQGQSKRMQLAWISEERDRFIFVNERGQKNADLSAVQLARQLSRGVQPPTHSDEMGLVDRSVYESLEQRQKTLSFERNHDSLTRLINKQTFLDQMNRALVHARARNSQHAVLYLDIDQFSLVNDLYDRLNGDQVLLEFGKLLSQLHGKKSSSARICEDEFAVLLLDRSMEEAGAFADKVRTDIETGSITIEGESVSFTASIGVAPIQGHSPEVEKVLESARSAKDLAKEQGRNRVVAYAEDQAKATKYRAEKARSRQDLEQALQTDRFVLRAQPIVQTAVDGGESVKRFELLLGWREQDGTVASPGNFIKSAERYGFMTLVDRWVVREAFSWISHLMDDQKVVPHLAINLSGASITDDSFMEYLFEQISEFGVGTNRICFEITEAGTISNLVKAADFVRAFRNIGCKFSVDDFGTGLASHDFLRELPVDYVKIDGSFIKGIDSNRNDYAMARSINDLAHFLGQQTIAESVENEEIITRLREIGVDYLQGWGVGKPKLLQDISQELSSIEK
jgi:diguanylate cyclase (GGDEF)-like protein